MSVFFWIAVVIVGLVAQTIFAIESVARDSGWYLGAQITTDVIVLIAAVLAWIKVATEDY